MSLKCKNCIHSSKLENEYFACNRSSTLLLNIDTKLIKSGNFNFPFKFVVDGADNCTNFFCSCDDISTWNEKDIAELYKKEILWLKEVIQQKYQPLLQIKINANIKEVFKLITDGDPSKQSVDELIEAIQLMQQV